MKTAVFINYSSNNGKARKKWLTIENDIRKILPADTCYIPYETPCSLKNIIQCLIKFENIRYFVSAGGDGSLNYLVNLLAEITDFSFENLAVGAIALGSSNDFHKPFRNQVKGIPVRIDFNSLIPQDAGLVAISGSEQTIKKAFVINASLGFTAEGNLYFNNGGGIIRFLKPRSVQSAILWAVIKTLISYRNLSLQLKIDGEEKKCQVTNLSIAKNPHVSGNFCYDISTAPDSGKLGLYLAENLNRSGIIKLLYHLSRNRFSTQKNCSVVFSENIEINSGLPVACETDGEVFLGTNFRFSVLPGVLNFAT
ncbi:MAG: hypothetical protein JW833_15180 [Prolixibacteraceae bacterium]|nr:hypothetical protein [Prolixibacteraceae bacterium]